MKLTQSCKIKWKNVDEEDLQQKQISTAEKLIATGNQSAKKAKQSTEKAVDNNLPKDWIQPKGLSKDNIISDINKEYLLDVGFYIVNMLLLYLKLNLRMWMMLWMIVIWLLLCKMNSINSQEMM